VVQIPNFIFACYFFIKITYLGKYCWGNSPPNTPRACQIVDNFLEWALRNYRQFDMHSGYYYVMTIHKKVLQMCTIMNTCLASWKKFIVAGF
jgi:hypothetical protein